MTGLEKINGDRLKRHFSITGLARSRTAWLANLLTWANPVTMLKPASFPVRRRGRS